MPSTKEKFQQRRGAKIVKLPEEATLYRALSARADYLAQDRPDIAISNKELCREFAVPTHDSFCKQKKVVRHLLHLPRLVYVYNWQELRENINMYTDIDFAGCTSTRRSTSWGIAMVGNMVSATIPPLSPQCHFQMARPSFMASAKEYNMPWDLDRCMPTWATR